MCSSDLTAIEEGIFESGTHRTYALADAARAHHDMESRRSTGSLVLVP